MPNTFEILLYNNLYIREVLRHYKKKIMAWNSRVSQETFRTKHSLYSTAIFHNTTFNNPLHVLTWITLDIHEFAK